MAIRRMEYPRHTAFFLPPAAAFFRFAQAAFIAIDIFDLNSVSSADGVTAAKIALFFEGAFFGAAASAFAALIAAQRRFCPSAILRRAEALTFRFLSTAGAVATSGVLLTQSGIVPSSPPRASIAA